MARHGENIRKRKDGRWEGRYPVYNAEKEKQVYRSVYGRSYEEARERLAAKKNLLKDKSRTEGEEQAQSLRIPEEIVFGDMFQDWLMQIKEKRKLSTYVKYHMIYRNHLEESFGNAALSEITDAFVRERIQEPLSDSFRSSIYCVMNQVLKFAADKYAVPITGLKKPASEMNGRPVKIFSRQEQKKLLSTLYHEMDFSKMAVLFCLFTGLRLGEICALKWEDIDWENQILVVRRTVQRLYAEGRRTKTALMETGPKSEYSRREIPLPVSVLELLLKFRGDQEYVFGGDRPMEPRTLQYHFKRILREAGLQDANFHILRHTFSTNCIEGGADVKSLSEMLGHADVQITLNRYVHPSMDIKRRYMNELSRFYGQVV
ncbi:MAG: site-specific integrase [Bacteroides fragilis]|nr:site-specific integrase [Bacteroides fragilis]